LKREKAELQSQLANATGDEKEVALLNAITAKDNAIASYNNQLTELYKHLPSQAPPAGILSFFMISTRNHI